MWEIFRTIPLLGLMELASELFAGVHPRMVQPGRTFLAARDIHITRYDRDRGFIETKFAQEGDELSVLELDSASFGALHRVKNTDNHDQIDSVSAHDLDDAYGEYSN
jgi:hypothetical protein